MIYTNLKRKANIQSTIEEAIEEGRVYLSDKGLISPNDFIKVFVGMQEIEEGFKIKEYALGLCGIKFNNFFKNLITSFPKYQYSLFLEVKKLIEDKYEEIILDYRKIKGSYYIVFNYIEAEKNKIRKFSKKINDF